MTFVIKDSNFLTHGELVAVGRVIEALNEVKPPEALVSFEVNVVDSNGENAGRIDWAGRDIGYAYYPAHPNPHDHSRG